MIFGPPNHARSDGVEFHVTESGGPVVGIEHGGVEAALPEVASVAVDGIAIGGVEAAQVHHEKRNGIGLVADGDQMEVIRTPQRSWLRAASRSRKYWRSAPDSAARAYLTVIADK